MILVDLVEVLNEVQIAYGKEVMPPKVIDNLEKYWYCPILNIKPGVYNHKPTVRVFIDATISPSQRSILRQAYMKRNKKLI